MSLTRRPWQLRSIPTIYAPLLPWFLWQMFLNHFRHGIGLAGILRSAPPMGNEGYWEFRKARIYSVFAPSRFAISTVLVGPPHPSGPDLKRLLRDRCIEFPLVAKPNLGTMSMGVRMFKTQPELEAFLAQRPIEFVLQPYIDDALEYAIFYYRMPHDEHGSILDLTERVLPEVVGDGNRSVELLVRDHPGWTGLASAILANYDGEPLAVPALGERIRLAPAASGARGAVFRDSRHLATEELCRAIDEVAVPAGFLFGKFDIKVPTIDDLKQGQRLKILEVNPVGAEINCIYDHKWRYLPALSEIRKQYRTALRIAIAHSRDLPRAQTPPTLGMMIRRTLGLWRACKNIAMLEESARG